MHNIVYYRLSVGPVVIDTARTVCVAGSVQRSSVRLSVYPSVCPIDRQQQRPPVGLLLSAPWTGDIDR